LSIYPILTQTMRFTSKTAYFSLKIYLIDNQCLIGKISKMQALSPKRQLHEMLKLCPFSQVT
ncbi:MAG: hypothetical protein NC224_06565, partial [Bacteroides sp.]|nr:hypothetical protein [Bacteroides sp.]